MQDIQKASLAAFGLGRVRKNVAGIFEFLDEVGVDNPERE
jgi:hypothetical protein